MRQGTVGSPETPEQYNAVELRVKELATELLTAAYKLNVKERVEALGVAREAVAGKPFRRGTGYCSDVFKRSKKVSYVAASGF